MLGVDVSDILQVVYFIVLYFKSVLHVLHGSHVLVGKMLLVVLIC